MSTSGTLRTLASRRSAQGKADTMSAFSVKQDVANQHLRNAANLGFAAFRPRKVRQDVGAFRKASQASPTRLHTNHSANA